MRSPLKESRNLKLAYFLSRYPAVSHTFFLKEILGLRKLGLHIETASVNLPDRPFDKLPATEVEEARQTYFLKSVPFWEVFRTLVTVTFGYPQVALRGARFAIQLGGWNLYRKIYALFYLVEAFLLGHWMRKNDLNHLHTHFGGSVATVAMLAAHAWDFDYSLTIHGPEEFYEVEDCYLPAKIAQAKFVFCISDFCRSQLMKYCDPVRWDKMQVIRLGVDPDEFKPVHRGCKKAFEIVCVGRLVPAKGQHILLRALLLLQTKGHNLHLRLIGDGPDRTSLEDAVRRSDADTMVTFCGALNHDETRKQLAEADIFALASFAEGIPIALMEAMAMGIPCVSTNVAGIPELIRHNIDGLLVPASSVEALAEAIEALIVDADLRGRFAQSGRERVLDCYNLPANLEALAAAFQQKLA
jgi:colanic acid/amylovoran biosynthesis glycosyltransferase